MPRPKGFEPYMNVWQFDLKFYTFKNNAWYHVKYVLHFSSEAEALQMNGLLKADRNNTVSDVIVIQWLNRRDFIMPELDRFNVIGTQYADFPF
jgi:hypothetical protein